MKLLRRSSIWGAAVALVLGAGVISSSLNSCATLNALAGLSRIQFMLQNVQSVRLAGIDVANKHSVSDFSVMDGINLMGAFSSGHFPLTFTLNVAAKNPNAPNAAYGALQVTDFPWRLLLDGHETISGNIGAPIGVPAGGSTAIMPLQVTVDLKQFFANQGYNDMINLALALSGQGGSSHIQLKAVPTMATPIGSMRYPGELTIVNTEFRS
ncbi:MAG: hypothetical protein Q8922_13110 [Bacteroidota bacterium]|nr:hypothetical protein [Bacteroidota bacterium]MDP4234692.1 hypothetical protein [Bacteroidota bacterium]MDP4243915.1 hypothetical protein [Bacteroidota bacterium]MDP4288862.1 hypothetical protein [Bacteroidota bacterium]